MLESFNAKSGLAPLRLQLEEFALDPAYRPTKNSQNGFSACAYASAVFELFATENNRASVAC
jgi:hypothetical protein